MLINIKYKDNNQAVVTAKSDFSGKVRDMVLNINKNQVYDWKVNDNYIQNAFPNLNDDEREFLLTGVTPEEWQELFGDEK